MQQQPQIPERLEDMVEVKNMLKGRSGGHRIKLLTQVPRKVLRNALMGCVNKAAFERMMLEQDHSASCRDDLHYQQRAIIYHSSHTRRP